MKISQTTKGSLFVLSESFLFALFPVVTILSYSHLSPFISLGFSTLFACVFFACATTIKKSWHELQQHGIWKDLFFTSFFIGVLYYALYFWGLKYTVAGNASLIDLMETFFSFLLFNIWQKEYISTKHLAGALLMLIGAVIVLFPKSHHLNVGDLLVLIASIAAPCGNFFQQRVRNKISSEVLLFIRSLFTLPFLIIFIILFREKSSPSAIYSSLWLLLLNGVILLGFAKLLWVEGIHRISVTKASALTSIGPAFTLLFAFIFLHQLPNGFQLLAFFPLAGGLLLLLN